MRLFTKVALVLAAVITLSVALNYAVLKTTVMPAFAQLERETAEQNMQRVIDVIEGDLNYMSLTLQDWAFWDDSYDFALDEPAGARADYIDANLYLESLSALDVDIMYFFDASGALIWGMAADLEAEEEIPADRIMPPDLFAAGSPVFDHAEPNSITIGIVSTGGAPLLLASANILGTLEGGPPVGTMIVGRLLDDGMIEALRDQTHVAFHLESADGHQLPEATVDALGGYAADGHYLSVEDGDTTSTFGVLRDLAGAVATVVRVETPRDITAIGERTTRYTLLSLLAAGLVVMAVIGLLLQRVVLRPIGELTGHVLSIKRTGDLSRRWPMHRDDEIGILSAEFDRMLGQLDSARQELVDQSYNAGIAEMAAGVLHSIRNQLSPLTMRIGQLRKLLDAADKGNARQAIDELMADTALSERSAKLAQYLKLCASQSGETGQKALSELDVMNRQLARVEDVLDEQDRFSHAQRVIEPVKLSDVVARAISLMPDTENSGLEMAIDSGIAKIEAVLADRFALTQMVNNLLINAAEAIRAGGVEGGRIDITAALRRSGDGGEEIVLEIRDNGVGIAADVMPQIFERGFTTKGGGKGGFGLHWCANTVATLNGRIHADSQGTGQGASVHLVIPLRTAMETAA